MKASRYSTSFVRHIARISSFQVITDPERLEELERSWLREHAGRRSFAEALDVYWSCGATSEPSGPTGTVLHSGRPTSSTRSRRYVRATGGPAENGLADLLAARAQGLQQQGMPYVVIGGQAVVLHGEPRLTADIDITLGIDYDHLESVRDLCRALGLRELPSDVPAFARDTRVLRALDPATGVRVDLIFSFTSLHSNGGASSARLAWTWPVSAWP